MSLMRLRKCASAWLLFVLVADSSASELLQFNRDIRPVLSSNCFSCHGPDSSSREAGLRLDQPEVAREKGAIVGGDPGSSLLVKRILSNDPDELMPPPESHKSLTPREKALLQRWIEEGARYEKHWSYIPPSRPSVPVVADEGWSVNPIDRFVFRRAKESGLTPSLEAPKHVLARRVALDLTGLPPDPLVFEQFMADSSPDAYERLVDQLLSSTSYGEHRARYWLDAARYGDTHGMHLDNYREMWPYRDWVIGAFNENKPFDAFVREQIAGDLLPDRTDAEWIATGFNRCNVSTAEGGSIPEELKVRYMVDRVETTATVFLGLTAGCAVCHDHKYDPITQKDFYSLGAFFNNTVEPAMDGNRKDSPPVIVLPEEQHAGEWRHLEGRRRMLLTSLDQLKARELPNGWVSTEDATELLGREDLLFEEDIAHAVGTSFPGDGRLAMAHPGGKRGVRFGKVGLEVPFPTLKTDQPFTLSFWVRTPDHVQSSTILEQTASVTDSRNPKKKVLVGWRVTSSVQGAVTFEITDRKGQKINGLLPGDEALAPRTWQHVCIRYSGGRSKTSISILVNGKQGTPRPASEAYLEVDVLASSPLEMGSRFETGGLSDIRAYRRWLTEEEVELLAQQFKIQDLAANHSDLSQIEKTEDRDLIKQVLRFERQMEYVETLRSLAATELRRDFIKSRSTTSLVTQERTDASPRAWILKRGEYDQRGAEVFADVPGFLPPLPKGLPRNRLGLAEWLVDRGNPLTARVMVNRLWQSVFGRGIVRTSEDFGVMGSVPTHPELLDWLAVEFMESGWDVSGLLKLMVTSSTYRQDSRISRESSDKDPENAFLARGIRIRLDAEMIRDQALSLGGLLMPKAGGRSVNPYQPEGLWKVVAFAGSNTREFKQDEGEALYRRSIYTFWKRTSPPASMAAFDAPTREQCTVRRERTNTPLQALVLMNDTQFVEAARGFAVRTLEANNEDRKRVEWMLEHALYRPALKEDHLGVMSLIQGFREYFRESPDRAKALVSVGESKAGRDEDPIEIAAWTMAASTLMNRDDFVTKN